MSYIVYLCNIKKKTSMNVRNAICGLLSPNTMINNKGVASITTWYPMSLTHFNEDEY